MNNKKQIRDQVLFDLEHVDPLSKHEMELMIYNQLFSSELWKNSKSICITMSTDREINTKPIIDEALKNLKKVYIPKVSANRELTWFEYTDNIQLDKSKFGILEPKSGMTLNNINDIDLAIVPGVAFTNNGARLGYGGGYYDHFLAQFQHHNIALALDQQILDYIPMDTFDKKISNLITPNGYYSFSNQN